jgi:hypothetical protein
LEGSKKEAKENGKVNYLRKTKMQVTEHWRKHVIRVMNGRNTE